MSGGSALPAVAGGAPALTASGVGKHFAAGSRQIIALDGISLELPAGAVSGLIGPDGAGKTTLLRIMAGLLAPSCGQLSVLGRDPVADPGAVHALVGYMPQRFGLYEDLTVRENLDLYADLHGVSGEARQARFQELLAMTRLEPFQGRLAGKLSGGMKQKLGLACTLVARPRLLLLDEPTVGVDPVSRRELWRIVQRMVETGTTVLMSTAYLDEAERCSRVFVLHAGRLIDQGAPDERHAPMEGRCFAVSGSADSPGETGAGKPFSKRHLQSRLAALPGVVDAVIQGDWVRVVTAEAAAPDLTPLGSDLPPLTAEPLPPRFEDGFMARLKPLIGQTALAPLGTGSAKAIRDGDTVIEVQGVERWFGDFQAVKRVSFEVRRGEVFGLLGANGAGKTTTFRMLCGLLPASRGRLRVAGVDLRVAAARARARIGYMSQKFSLYGALSVLQNLEFFCSAYRLRGDRKRARLQWALEQFQLGPHADQASGDLPLGHKQRLALACALLHEPEILFLDEPTSGVDPLMRRAFWSTINALAEQGVTVLVTTHFMEEAEYCDRLVIMAAGSVLAAGRPADIRAQARGPGIPNPTLEDAFIRLLEQSGDNGEATMAEGMSLPRHGNAPSLERPPP